MFGLFRKKPTDGVAKKSFRRVRIYKQLPEPKLVQLPLPADVSGLEGLREKKRIERLNHSFVSCRRQYIEFTSESGIAVFPAWELVRVLQGVECAIDWTQRWRDSGGKFYEGRMIASADDPIWAKISDFGVPYPPFDQSGVFGISHVARSECKRLGVDVPITSVQIEMRKAGIKLQTKVVSIKRGVE